MPDDAPTPARDSADTVAATPAGPAASRSALRRELAVYTALRVGLIAVLAVLLRLSGLFWLPAIALAVVLAALLSFVLLRRPMQRLAGAMAGRRGAAAPRSVVPGGATRSAGTGIGTPGATAAAADYDPYEDDPYEDDLDDDADDGRDTGGDGSGQDASSSARPTSSP